MALPGLDLRDGVDGLATLASSDLDVLWRQVSTPAEAEAALRDVLPALIDTYGAAAGTLAADWYDEHRDMVDAKGNFRAFPADIPDTGAQSLVGWATSTATDYTAFQSLILGGMQRRIANFSRLTVVGSSVADPATSGWQRTGSGECTFCDMLIGRGAVYSEATADFASHDHCRCSAVPAFKGKPQPVKPYTPSTRKSTDADRARVRAYLRDN
jgi:hypothetical protein